MSRLFTLLVLALLLALPGAVLAQGKPAETSVKEPDSGIAFPVELSVLDGAKTYALAGVGIRTKFFVSVNIYAMGLYVDAQPAGEALAKWKGKKPDDLADDDDFYEKLLQDGFGKTMHLVLARDIDGETMAEAFDEALEPRMKRLTKKGVAGKMADLKTFRGYFSLDELVEGTQLTFTWEKGGKLTSAMNGKKLGAIESLALAQSLFDVYLGEDPIEDDAKETLVKRFPRIIEAAAAKKASPPKKAR